MAHRTPKPRRRGHRYAARSAAPPGLSLLPVVTRLADDTWQLALKSPALPADPALLETAGRLLGQLRPLLRGEPVVRLLPRTFPPGIRLHALALGLRQLQVVLDGLALRHDGPDDIDALVGLHALYLRHLTETALAGRGVRLPPKFRLPGRPPPPDATDAGEVIPAPPGPV